MSLLLTFFILLLSLSEIKKEDEFRAIVKEVKKAFGMHGGGGKVPTKDDPELSFIERIRALQLISRKEPQKSDTPTPGMEGPQERVTHVRPTWTHIEGGRVTFEPGSADLNEQMRKRLATMANLIRGYNYKVRIGGHADTGEFRGDDAQERMLALSYQRALTVRGYLVDECGIRAVRLKVVANADAEKLIWDVYDPEQLKTNRRAEVMVSDSLVDEMSRPELNSSN